MSDFPSLILHFAAPEESELWYLVDRASTEDNQIWRPYTYLSYNLFWATSCPTVALQVPQVWCDPVCRQKVWGQPGLPAVLNFLQPWQFPASHLRVPQVRHHEVEQRHWWLGDNQDFSCPYLSLAVAIPSSWSSSPSGVTSWSWIQTPMAWGQSRFYMSLPFFGHDHAQ